MKWLKTIDYFGVNAELRVNSQKTYKTKFGGSVFLFWILTMLTYILYSFILWVTKENCISYYSNQIILPSPKINLSSLNFMAAIALMHENYSIPDSHFDEYLEYEFIHEITNYRDKANKIKEKIPLKKCNFSDFETIEKSTFANLNISEYLCPKEINRTIEGLFTDNVYSLVKFVVSIKNTVIDDPIKFNTLYNYLLKNILRMNIYFIDTAIDLSNTEKPVTHYINSFVTFIDMLTYKRIHLEFMLSKFYDDNTIWFKSSDIKDILKFSSGREYFFGIPDRQESINQDSRKFVTFYLRSDQNNLIIKREYQKLSLFLASFSSVLSSSLILLLVFMKFINDYFLNQYLIFKSIFFKEDILNNAELQKNLKSITDQVKKSLLENRFSVNNVFENTERYDKNFRRFKINSRGSKKLNFCPGFNFPNSKKIENISAFNSKNSSTGNYSRMVRNNINIDDSSLNNFMQVTEIKTKRKPERDNNDPNLVFDNDIQNNKLERISIHNINKININDSNVNDSHGFNEASQLNSKFCYLLSLL